MRVMNTPKTVEIAVTGRCNLSCSHCSLPSGTDAEQFDLPLEEWIEFFQELGRCAVLEVAIGGGEPFTRRNILEMIAGIVENRMRLFAMNFLNEFARKSNINDFVRKIISTEIQMRIKKEGSKIYPVRFSEIARIKVLRSPEFKATQPKPEEKKEVKPEEKPKEEKPLEEKPEKREKPKEGKPEVKKKELTKETKKKPEKKKEKPKETKSKNK